MSPDIQLQRWFDAPPEVVFDAYTEAPSGDVERGFTEGWNEFLDGLVARIQTRSAA